MPNPNPHVARAAKRKHSRMRKIGTLADMRKELWRAVLCAKDVMLDASEDPATTLKAVHAITSAATAYAKLVEVDELEARITEIEQQQARTKTNGRAYA